MVATNDPIVNRMPDKKMRTVFINPFTGISRTRPIIMLKTSHVRDESINWSRANAMYINRPEEKNSAMFIWGGYWRKNRIMRNSIGAPTTLVNHTFKLYLMMLTNIF